MIQNFKVKTAEAEKYSLIVIYYFQNFNKMLFLHKIYLIHINIQESKISNSVLSNDLIRIVIIYQLPFIK